MNRKSVLTGGPQVARRDEIRELLSQATRRVKLLEIAASLVAVVAFVVLFFVIEVVVDHLVALSKPARLVFLIALCLFLAYILVRMVLMPLARRVNALYVAKLYDEKIPELDGSLSSYVDLARDEDIPEEFTDILSDEVLPKLKSIKLADVIAPRQLRRAAIALVGVLIFTVLYTVFSPKSVVQSLKRAYRPLADILPPVKTEVVNVSPGDDGSARAVEGDSVEIVATLSGSKPDAVNLMMSTDTVTWRTVPMMRLAGEKMMWRAVIPKVRGSFAYYVRAGDGESRHYRMFAVSRPEVATLSFEIEFPEYMELARVRTAKPNLETHVGARVTVEGTGTKPLASAAIHMEGLDVPLEITDGRKFTGTFTVTGSSRYWFHLVDALGTTSYETRFSLIAHRDELPTISIERPRAPVVQISSSGGSIPVEFAVQDDFGLSSVRLVLEVDGETFSLPVDVPPGTRLLERVAREVLVTPDRFSQGDRIDCWVEACDNRAGEPGTKSSSRFSILVDVEPPALEADDAAEIVEASGPSGTETDPVRVKRPLPPEEITVSRAADDEDDRDASADSEAPATGAVAPLVDAEGLLLPKPVASWMRATGAARGSDDVEPEMIRLTFEDAKLLETVAEAVRQRAQTSAEADMPIDSHLASLAGKIKVSLAAFMPPEPDDTRVRPEQDEQDEEDDSPDAPETPTEVYVTEDSHPTPPDPYKPGRPGTVRDMHIFPQKTSSSGASADLLSELVDGAGGAGGEASGPKHAEILIENIGELMSALGKDTALAEGVRKDLGWLPGELTEFTWKLAKDFKVTGLEDAGPQGLSDESIGGAGAADDLRVRLAQGDASVKEIELGGPGPEKGRPGDLFESRREVISPEYRDLVKRYFEALQRTEGI